MEKAARGLAGEYLAWPSRLLRGFTAGVEAHGSWEPPALLVGCGMGGSAYSVEASSALLGDLGYTLLAWRSHRPPGMPGAGVVAVSYSGETIETIECARASLDLGRRVSGVAGRGSSLHRLLASRGAPVATLEGGGLPRASLAELVGALVGLVAGEEAKHLLERVAGALDAGRISAEARRVAGLLAENAGIPVVVVAACDEGGVLVSRWRSELAENAGIPVLGEAYPEAGHNSVVVWDYNRLEGPVVILQRGGGDPLCRAMEDFILERYGNAPRTVKVDLAPYEEVHPLAAILASAMIAGLASVWVAEALGRDPAETRGIQEYKAVLGRAAARDARWGPGAR